MQAAVLPSGRRRRVQRLAGVPGQTGAMLTLAAATADITTGDVILALELLLVIVLLAVRRP